MMDRRHVQSLRRPDSINGAGKYTAEIYPGANIGVNLYQTLDRRPSLDCKYVATFDKRVRLRCTFAKSPKGREDMNQTKILSARNVTFAQINGALR